MKIDNISGYPGYHISKKGNLYSRRKGNSWLKVKGMVARGRLQYRLYYTPDVNTSGKHHQWGKLNSKSKWEKSSRLVALAWVKNPEPGVYNIVCHLDNNPLNNYYKNLYWGTQKINIQQALHDNRFYQCKRFGEDNPMFGKVGPMLGRKGKLHPAYGRPNKYKGKEMHPPETRKAISEKLSGSNHPNYKINENMKKEIISLRSSGKSQTIIANIMGLHQTTVSKILKTYNHG